ncbi:hypothetical protein Sru01_15970 [Sphaerisporangium rufum]|uniref:Uncharacterized protein n=1 Tax=Sphaerisporangium rufum TaxID=1381558 RepID=A0A919R1E2_9ACTN|nr:hypothetical protein [Sphaerisporangium rufum]GII76615.1 hypothetical protein Sru01_15970 [Sphaerisporangium rufum]
MDGVRPCLAMLGLGLIIAGVFARTATIMKVVEVRPVDWPTRAGLAAAGVVIVLVMLALDGSGRRAPLRRLTGMLVGSLLTLGVATLAGVIAFPALPARAQRPLPAGSWHGRLAHSAGGRADVRLTVSAGGPHTTATGRLTLSYNGAGCEYWLDGESVRQVMKAAENNTPQEERICGGVTDLRLDPYPDGKDVWITLTGRACAVVAQGALARQGLPAVEGARPPDSTLDGRTCPA